MINTLEREGTEKGLTLFFQNPFPEISIAMIYCNCGLTYPF